MENYVLLSQLNQLLTPEQYQDYCPNGLQIEGDKQVKQIITGVSITEELIDQAIFKKANAIIVHHGLFWHKEDYALTGVKKHRIAKLLAHGINLYAYHLPLDNHNQLGNNVQLAKKLGIRVLGNTDKQNLLWLGKLDTAISLEQWIKQISFSLQRQPLCFAKDTNQLIQNVAWCTGGADNLFNAAINLGVDAYITGEAAEPSMSLAKESKVAYIAAGHYTTERYGIIALTKYLKQNLNLPSEFIELYNPV